MNQGLRESVEPGLLFLTEPLALQLDDLRTHFASGHPVDREIRNPHIEPRVSEQTRAAAVDSAVLVLITDEPVPRVLLTERQMGIRFGGHLCFPGGRADAKETMLDAALRESSEEIGVHPKSVDLLGGYGRYFTQAGYRIDPFVGIIEPDYPYRLSPAEVASLHFAPLHEVLNPKYYKLNHMTPQRAYFGFEIGDVRVGGPTISLMIGLMEWLAEVQAKN